MHPHSIDSGALGDPARHLTLAQLNEGLQALPPAPKGKGRVVLIVRKGERGVRHVLDVTELTLKDPPLTVMQADIARLMANGQPLELFGDNLFLDLDLSTEGLPTGSLVRVGKALLEVMLKPHNGCRKFLARFGPGAMQFVSRPETRHRNFRGVYMRVKEPGELRRGDSVEKVS